MICFLVDIHSLFGPCGSQLRGPLTPHQAGRQLHGSKLQVHHSARPLAGAAVGRMQQQRLHQHGAPGGYDATGGCRRKVGDVGRGHHPALVRARHYFRRAVGCSAVVEANADGAHIFQHGHRGLHRHTLRLASPGAKTGRISPLLHIYHQVLVPGNQPIGAGRLVEINGFYEMVSVWGKLLQHRS